MLFSNISKIGVKVLSFYEKKCIMECTIFRRNAMKISGLQKTTLLDFPGKVACTVFLSGCNFRCPFCQNGEILDIAEGEISEKEFFDFLEKRKGILDGVCVSGGEPLLQAGTEEFIRKIKLLGYAVKLDTNGSFPEKLKSLVLEGLVDFVAMDIKNSRAKYERTAGVHCDFSKIEESIAFLLSGKVEYEFRTTAVKEFHKTEDFIDIGKRIKGAKRYFLQNFKDSEFVLQKGLTPFSDDELQTFKRILKPFVPSVLIRGENG